MSDVKKKQIFLIQAKDLGNIILSFYNCPSRGYKPGEDMETNVLSTNSDLICHDMT